MHKTEVLPDPFAQFRSWFDQAEAECAADPTAMTLATVGESLQPAARLVLLKHLDERGFVFFSNYHSRKARDVSFEPQAALVFWWSELHYQVRIEGVLAQVTRGESEDYFASRSKGAQISAWASQQSEAVADRATMDAEYERLVQEFSGKKVPCPPHWGGYRLTPQRFEFWKGGEHRFHDRFEYVRDGGEWGITRLYP